jgi:uncharacterized protein (TIGR01777 family)
MSRNILITGGTGFLGSELTKRLTERGFSVRHLSRNPVTENDIPVFKWDIKRKIIDDRALEDVECIIHLAGANIASERWSQERKKEIFDSRVKSSELLYYILSNKKHQVKSVISASAIGYYGHTGDRLVTEESVAGFDYLAYTCKQWEHAINKVTELGIRTCNVRIGFVLANNGGGLPRLLSPIRFYMGAPLGDGLQYVSWIHIDDLCNIFIKAVEDSTMSGPYNAVAPNPITNKELIKLAANILDKSLFLPSIPAGLLKMWMGEMATLVLTSTNASAKKIIEKGYHFKFPDIEPALRSVLAEE